MRIKKGLAVLLHAAGSSPRSLAKLADLIETEVGRTLSPALPANVLPGHESPLLQQVEIVAAALEQAGSQQKVLFGHSFGGLIAVLTMLEGAAVACAILYEPIVTQCLDPSDDADVSAKAFDRQLIDFLAERTAANDPEPGVARFVEAYNEVSWNSLPEKPRAAMIADASNLVELTQSVHHQPIDLGHLRRLSVPILVMHGDRSPDVVQRMSRRLQALLPCAELAVVSDAGHMAPNLEPERVFQSMAAFLADNLVTRGTLQPEKL